MKGYFETIETELEKYDHLGKEILEDGTILIGKAPHIGPKAWLHKIYTPLTNEEIKILEGELDNEIATEYKNFLLNHSNGLKIFGDVLSLDGLRKKQGRSIAEAYQPYSIVTVNTIERLEDADELMFFIGGYNLDGSLLYIKDGKVNRCSNETTTPLNVWNSFSEMLLSEVERICLLHDKNGVLINPNEPTVPFG